MTDRLTPAQKYALNYRQPNQKLTEEQRREIEASTEPGWILAERYGISRPRVTAIRGPQRK